MKSRSSTGYLRRTRLHPILGLLALVGALLVGSSAFTAITNAGSHQPGGEVGLNCRDDGVARVCLERSSLNVV